MRLSFLLLAFCIGIYGAGTVSLPLCYTGAAAVVCVVAACRSRRRYYLYAAVFFLGLFRTECRYSPASDLPALTVLFALSADGNGRSARLTAWRDDAGAWHGTDLRVRLYGADSAAAGQTMVVAGRFRRFDPDRSPYARRMRRCGYAGSLHLYPDDIVARASDTLAIRPTLHAAAVERVRRIPLSPDAQALVTALAAGERSDFSPALREAYIRSGNAHLLAVSGLHIGIFCLLADTLSVVMLLFYQGNRRRNLVVILAVWLYVAATGCNASAVRAALMFTVYLSMRRSGRHTDSRRVLAVTALVMLAINPLWLHDIGFQISFLAMAGILLWGVPLSRRLRCRRHTVNWFTGLSAVAVTATLATVPMTAHYFDRVSLLSPLLAAPTLLLSTAILALALVAMLLPCTHPVTAPLLDWLATLQNRLVTRVSALPCASIDLSLTAAQTLGLYLMLLSATLLVCKIRRPKPPIFGSGLNLSAIFYYSGFSSRLWHSKRARSRSSATDEKDKNSRKMR